MNDETQRALNRAKSLDSNAMSGAGKQDAISAYKFFADLASKEIEKKNDTIHYAQGRVLEMHKRIEKLEDIIKRAREVAVERDEHGEIFASGKFEVVEILSEAEGEKQ